MSLQFRGRHGGKGKDKGKDKDAGFPIKDVGNDDLKKKSKDKDAGSPIKDVGDDDFFPLRFFATTAGATRTWFWASIILDSSLTKGGNEG